ncbi:sensor histidine kinase [Leifsonia sp. RAF41]|uniref:sensor histidine kinase n=1 Tax=Leifsonia sp. RAF41 TaxID=3233056 RepID=UPI003F9B5CF5
MVDPRWRTVLTVTPYLVLAALAAFAIATRWGDQPRLVSELALCVGYGAWVVVFRDLRFPWYRRPAAIAVLMTGVVVINLVLVQLDSWFAFLTIATFSMAYSLVRWPWELLAVAATAAVAGLAQASSFGLDAAGFGGRAIVVALNIVVMCGLSWGLRLTRRQSDRAATEAERSRLAREIHDTLAQGFAGIVTQLQAAEHAPDEKTRARHSDAALTLAREGLAEARRSVQALRPVALDAAALPEAVAATARRWSDRTGIPVDVRIGDATDALPTEVEVALLRTAQEALANIERHAHARTVTLTLRQNDRCARLEVRDDGRGFRPDAPPASFSAGGYGLIAMRERIEALAGHVVIVSGPGQGTSVVAEVPG